MKRLPIFQIYTFFIFVAMAFPVAAQDAAVTQQDGFSVEPAVPNVAPNVVSNVVPNAAPATSSDAAITPEMRDYPVVKLRSLDKVTARTQVFEARVGRTLQFGSIYIKARACRKTAPIEKPEAAAFLQIWDYDQDDTPHWVFSGWMFGSSPALSAMDHPIYDVWVLDCLDEQTGEVESGEIDEEALPAAPDVDAAPEGMPE